MLIAFLLGALAGIALQLQQSTLWEPFVYLALGIACLAGLAGKGLWAILLASPQSEGFGRAQSAANFPASPATLPRPNARFFNLKRWSLRLATALLALGLAFSFVGWRAVQQWQSVLDPALEGQDIDVVGVISSMPQRLESGLRFRFDVEAAHLNERTAALPPRLLLSWYRTDFSRDASDDDAPASGSGDAPALDVERLSRAPQAGERWRMTVRLKAPHGNSNPHGFDYELWLWEQGIGATGYVRDSRKRTAATTATAQQASAQRLGLVSSWGSLGGLTYAMERARATTRDAIFRRLNAPPAPDQSASAGIIAALVMGDQNAIERANWDVFRAAGVAHLMSISGLHITLFAYLASWLISRLWRLSALASNRRIARACLLLPASAAGLWGGALLATLYAWFSGWGVPAQRTVWMLLLFSLLRWMGLRWRWYVVWLCAAVLVLTLDPWAMYQAGFWLSFVAVATLLAADPPHSQDALLRDDPLGESSSRDPSRRDLSRRDPSHFWRWLPIGAVLRLLREQWIVTLALAPLSLLLFQQISLVGFAANLVAIPVVTLVLTPLSLLGMVAAPLWSAAAWVCEWLAAWLQWLTTWRWAVYSAPAPPLALGVVAVLGGILLCLPRPLLLGAGRFKALWIKALLAPALIAPALLWRPAAPAWGEFDLLAMDIGQGNAVLIRTAGHRLLFDAGPRFSRESDAGHRTIVPLLRALGERLDVLVLSHKDSDHTGGARAVLAMQPQATLMSSMTRASDFAAVGVPLERAASAQPCYAGQVWQWEGVRLEMLHPQGLDQTAEAKVAPKVASKGLKAASKTNAISCVLKVTSQAAGLPSMQHSAAPLAQHSALLAGDIEAPQEQMLLAQGAARLASTVLLVPHHGSKTSSSAEFLDAVRPSFAIVQAGYRNRFSHPHPVVMQRYFERSIASILTADCGAAQWSSQEPGRVRCQRQISPHYWAHKTDGAHQQAAIQAGGQ